MKSPDKPKAIAVDLDGTLLDSKKQVSQANREAITRCKEAGVMVVPATSRPSRSCKVLLKDTGLVPGPGVFLGGSVAIDADGNRCVDKIVPPDAMPSVLDTICRYAPGVWVTVERDETWYSNRLPDLELESLLTYGMPELMDIDELANQTASKIVVSWDNGSLKEVHTRLQEEFGSSLSYVLTTKEDWLEVLPADTAKEKALEVLLGGSGITLDECVAFGDGSNDVTFLAGCGRSVAMANAVPKCLEVATYVTKSNDEDGFAWAVREYLGIGNREQGIGNRG